MRSILNMRSKRVILEMITILLLFTLVVGLSFGAEKKKLTFWNMPFVTQEVSPDYVKMWESDAKTALSAYVVDNFYGPGNTRIKEISFYFKQKLEYRMLLRVYSKTRQYM